MGELGALRCLSASSLLVFYQKSESSCRVKAVTERESGRVVLRGGIKGIEEEKVHVVVGLVP